MSAPNDVAALVERPWRCDVTGNPVGTDARMIGAPPCGCQGCRAAATIAALTKERDDHYKGLLSERNRRKRHAERVAALQAEVERAKEDERDRLYGMAQFDSYDQPSGRREAAASAVNWLSKHDAMLPAARSASRKENTP